MKMSVKNLNQPVPMPDIKHLLQTTYLLVVVFLGGGFIWAYFAPLQSAAIAPGKVIVESFHKEVQHLDGGIVSEILIKDGLKVDKDDLLIKLDTTRIQANLNIVQGEQLALLAKEARLIAERDDLPKIPFPSMLLKQDKDDDLQKIIQGQTDIFKTNRMTFNNIATIYQNQIDNLVEGIEVSKKQIEEDQNRIFYLQKELNAIKSLVDSKKIEETMLWEMQGKLSLAQSERFEHERNMIQAENSIIEIKTRLITQTNERVLNIVHELRQVQRELAQVEQQIESISDQLVRTNITAPISGTIVNLKVHTLGGIIKTGETFLEIVPEDDKLIVEVQISPNDIDSVHPGLITNVKLSAYNTRYLPDLEGVLIYISPDALQNKDTGEYYYIGRIEISENELAKVSSIELYPGMYSEVMIVTDSRTFWEYFTLPIKNSLNRAFREQ